MRNFIEEYGFAILATFIAILLIATLTPIGQNIKDELFETSESFGERTNEEVVNLKKAGLKIYFSQMDMKGKFKVTVDSDSLNDLFALQYSVRDQFGNWSDYIDVGNLSTGSFEHSGTFVAKISNGKNIQARVKNLGKQDDVWYDTSTLKYTGETTTEEEKIAVKTLLPDTITLSSYKGSAKVSQNLTTTATVASGSPLNVISTNDEVASATNSSNKITITCKKAGTATVSIYTKSSDNYNAAATYYSVTCTN